MKAIGFKQFELGIALLALAADALAASPISVSNTNDDGDGSLRAAITEANQAGRGEITFSITNTITLLSPLPSLTNITITGPGTNLLTISGGNRVRVFSMEGGTTNTLSGLTIANGMAQGYEDTNGDYVFTYASGISNAGSLKLLNCVVQNCTNVLFSYGQGIYNAGDMQMEASVVANCGFDPLDYYSAIEGGGIYNSGTLRMTNCRVSSCVANNIGGVAVAGGGILNAGNLTMSASVIESCWTAGEDDGGGMLNQGTAVLCDCMVSNCSGFWGGGIESWGTLAMTNSIIVNNYCADLGGGLIVGGTNWLVGCTIARNGEASDGGGICTFGGELTMLNCTISQNIAWSCGGGIYNGGELRMLNCTISENIGRSGAGIYNGSSYEETNIVYANNCTIESNSVYNAGFFYSQNSIFAGNDTNDFSGEFTSQGFNLIQNTSGCTIVGDETGNIYGIDPLLGPLQDNGGPTWTHALLAGSPAIDAGSSVDPLRVDQRGIHRPQGLAPDIGAFEFQYATPALVRVAVQSCTNCCVVLCGLSGGIYTLQASTNLVNWFNVATSIADTNGVCAFTELGAVRCFRRFYRISLPVAPGSVYIPAPSGIVDAPFLIAGTNIYQPLETGIIDGGRAEYPFTVTRTGDYLLQTTVNAPNNGANSFFVNIDAEPQDPYMIWDIPVTTGFGQRIVSWRGNGTFDADQFVPKVFNLSQGAHQLIIRGREVNTLLQDVAILPYGY